MSDAPYGRDLFGDPLKPPERPTLASLEAAGARDVLHPEYVAHAVAASVMRRLLPHYNRVIGGPDMPKVIRDGIERDLRTALRSLNRWCGQCCPRGMADRG